jgi:processive 1,2-diacylglycerol beta-glucosyltransferase
LIKETAVTKILILHASLGAGHVSAAKALGEAFEQLGVEEVRVEDTLDFASKMLRNTWTKLYLRMSEASPQMYKLLYSQSDIGDVEDSLKTNKLYGQVSRPFMKRMETLVREMKPDAIVCAMQIPAQILQLMEMEGDLPMPNFVVVTDFFAHSTWINYGVDGYFVPSDLTKDVMIAQGMTPDKLTVTGIPVKLVLTEPKSKAEMRAKLELPADLPVVTIFGGGIVPARVRLMVSQLLNSDRSGVVVTVAGRNDKLATVLEDLTDGSQMKLRKLGMIDYVDDLVAASDLVVTKSGGLITSEVLARGTPLVIIDPIPGQEEWNADVVASSGAGIQLRMPEMVPLTVLNLLAEPKRLEAMRVQALKVGRPRAALDIAEQVLASL